MDFFSDKLKKFISTVVDISEDFNFEQFKVGRSNITFKIFDDSNTFVLRRPPFGLKLESAHNMGREYKILKVLNQNDLRVPIPFYLYDKKELSTDDFYIMEFIEGDTIANDKVAESYDQSQKKTITESFIKALTEIHNFNVISSELSDLGKHEDYVVRQINRWNKQFQSQKVREIKELESATNLLLDYIPPQQTVGIVHGDYRLDNVRVKDNKVAAVLDWELCTLGDPLADMGTVIASWNTKKENFEFVGDVRGYGIMKGVEIVENKQNKTSSKELATKIISNSKKNGLLLVNCGKEGNVIRFMGPLTTPLNQIKEAMEMFNNALEKI